MFSKNVRNSGPLSVSSTSAASSSGFFNDPAFKNTLEVLGEDRVFFSADYPFESMQDAADWYDKTSVISEEARLKIGRTNAIKLFNLDLD